MESERQKLARKRNWSLFLLRGAIANLMKVTRPIDASGYYGRTLREFRKYAEDDLYDEWQYGLEVLHEHEARREKV